MGFFSLDDLEITEPKVAKNVKSNKEVFYNCEQCGLYKNCNSPKMEYKGKGEKGILLVVNAPTVKADRIGEPIAGETKHIIRELCKKANLDMYNDIWIVNAIQCRHTKVNKATVPACRERLQTLIKELSPNSIIALGNTAIDVLLGDIDNSKADKLSGYHVPYIGYETVIYPTYGTKDLIIEKYNVVMEKKMLQAFIQAQHPEYINYEAILDIIQLHKASDIKNTLLNLESENLVAFDYETTGIQPYKKGHEIICMSVSNGIKSYVFMVHSELHPYIKHFLESDVKKIAHNAKFELVWSKAIFNVEVKNLVADTMLIAHSLNNTPGIVGLKFQTFANFGIPDYGKEMKALFDSDNVHDFNQLYYMKHRGELLLIQDKLLDYCAIDSQVTKWLYDKQLVELEKTPKLKEGVKLFLEGTKAFADIEYYGIKIDTQRVETNIVNITEQLELLNELIYDSDEVKQWDGKLFNFSSNPDLAHLLYDILEYPVYKTTPSGAPSVDAEALEKIAENENSQFIKLLLKYRKLLKIRDTYLLGIKNGTMYNYIHPSFNLQTAQTYRSSSSKPINLQNITKRDKFAKSMIRTVFIPDINQFLEELDFSTLEVNISQCYCQDENLLKYLVDPEHNMHTDSACDLFLRTKDTLLEEERQVTKGGFVFSQIYGSSYKNCAKKLWEDMPKASKIHLAKNGYKTLAQYTELVKEAEYQFWDVRFKDWGQWKRDNWKAYLANGYIDFYTGFRATTIMSPMQAGNIAIQGSAFHCLLYVMNYLHKELKNNKLESRILGEVHDSIIMSVLPDEEEIVHSIVKKALDSLKDNWDWITVQLTMEYEQGPINGDWTQVEKVGKIVSK